MTVVIILSGLLILTSWLSWALLDCPMFLFITLAPASLAWLLYCGVYMVFFLR